MKISLIIPTFNRSLFITQTLNSICKIYKENVLELIVVDNGSTDDTAFCVNKFMSNYPKFNIKYIYDPIPGLLTGRHRGAIEASGDILCFLDDDVELSSSWLQSVYDVFSTNKNIQLLTGPAIPKFEVYPPGWLKSFWQKTNQGSYCGWLSLLDFGDSEKFIDPNFVWGLNFSIRVSAYKALKGFHPDNVPARLQMFQGDGESGLTMKAAGAGYTAMYHPGVMVYHQVTKDRMTKEYFGKRAYFQGVCDSFTQLRREHGLYQQQVKKANSLNWKGRSVKALKNIYSNFHHVIDELKRRKNLKGEALDVLNYTSAQYKSGYAFHQNAFMSSDIIKQWVLRPDYLDYQLPIND